MYSLSRPSERSRDAIRRAEMRPVEAYSDWLAHWTVVLLAGVLTGLLGSFSTIFTNWLVSIREGHCNEWYVPKYLCCRERACTVLDQSPWSTWIVSPVVFITLSVLFAIGASLLVDELAPAAAVDGVPELTSYISGGSMPSLLRPDQIIIKAIATSLAAGSGLWIGPDSPMVHISASFAAALAPHFISNLSPSRARMIVASAAAAGLAVAMGSPIGGVLFVVETMRPRTIRSVLWPGFVCAMTATLVVELINPLETGKVVFFQVVYDRVWHSVELIPFAILGALGGLFGRFIDYSRSELQVLRERLLKRVPAKYQSFALVGSMGLVTALLSFTTVLKIPLHQLLAEALHECSASEEDLFCRESYALDLTYTTVVALLVTPASYGLGVPSGIMLPAVTCGALVGRLMGLIMRSILHAHRGMLSEVFCPGQGPCITPGVYALVGAAAALTGVTKLTISSAVILFELTGAISYIVPIMIGVMLAKWIVDLVGGTDVYRPAEVVRVLPEDALVPTCVVKDIMLPSDSVVTRDSEEAENRARHVDTALLSRSGKLVGYCPAENPKSGDVKDSLPMDATALVGLDSSALTAASIMDKLDVGTVLVAEKGEFKGVLTRDLVAQVMRSPPGAKPSDGSVFEMDHEMHF